jgi:hypothetical protein
MSSESSPNHVLLLSIPGLRQEDLSRLRAARSGFSRGDLPRAGHAHDRRSASHP